jgi:cytochrome c551/c552
LRTSVLVLLFLGGLSALALSPAEREQARELYVSRGCVGCHQNPELTKAPALTAVSAKYPSDGKAIQLLKTSLAKGSIGKWGAVEMPPQAHLTEAEQDLLTRWVIQLKATGEEPPQLAAPESWTAYGYHGKPKVGATWDSTTQELVLQTSVSGVLGLRRIPQRQPTEWVSLTVKSVSATGKPWGQVGVMIATAEKPQLLGSTPKYEWLVRRETNGAAWDYRVRKDVGTKNFELYSSGPIDPATRVKLEIVRNGDSYEFRANGKLHYRSGDNPQDRYDLATKNAMLYQGITFGGGGAFRTTITDLPAGAQIEEALGRIDLTPPQAVAARPSPKPDLGGADLLIERRKGNIIEIADQPLVYRTYLRGVPSRAITVGLPNKVSYAFDADSCRLAFAWKGGFLDVTKSWTGFGGWYSKLLGEKFYEAPEGFPLRIGALGKEPVLQFKGYDLKDGLPTFKYTVDGQAVRQQVEIGDGDAIRLVFELPGNDEPVHVLEDGRWQAQGGKPDAFVMEVGR